MRVYFMRHGEADWPNWQGADEERPLTDKGVKELKLIAEAIAGLKIEVGAVLTSPLRRCVQTAEIVARALGKTAAVESALAPGFDASQLAALIEGRSEELLLVGHEPDFSGAIRAVTGGDVKMARAGLACIEIIDTERMRGDLIWLVPPKVFKAWENRKGSQ
jgi:phosphohistidine phosphatase